MTVRALFLLAALLAAATASAADADTPFARLKSAPEPSARIGACAELARPPHRGTQAYQALHAAMGDDLSERVRLAAAVGAISYPGGRTLADIDAFLKSEPGAAVRRELLVALSSEAAHLDNPDATRIIAVSLAEDQSVEVRRDAAAALGVRGDRLALGALRRASEKDADKDVREAARRALILLSKPPKALPKPKLPDPPKPDAVFGVDPCPRPWGWCACAGAIALKPKCLTRPECGSLQAEMRHHDLECKWDSLGDE